MSKGDFTVAVHAEISSTDHNCGDEDLNVDVLTNWEYADDDHEYSTMVSYNTILNDFSIDKQKFDVTERLYAVAIYADDKVHRDELKDRVDNKLSAMMHLKLSTNTVLNRVHDAVDQGISLFIKHVDSAIYAYDPITSNDEYANLKNRVDSTYFPIAASLLLGSMNKHAAIAVEEKMNMGNIIRSAMVTDDDGISATSGLPLKHVKEQICFSVNRI